MSKGAKLGRIMSARPAGGPRSCNGLAELVKWLRGREEEMAKLLAELVAVPTQNPPGNNHGACAAILEKHVRRAGFECRPYVSTKRGKAARDERM